MRRPKAALFLMYDERSRTVEWFVELEHDDGAWTLYSEDTSLPSSAVLAGCEALSEWLKQTMEGSS